MSNSLSSEKVKNILRSITSENILAAMDQIDINNIPENRQTQYKVYKDNSHIGYPPPYLLEIANTIANKSILPDNFFHSVGEGSPHFDHLRRNRFEVRRPEGRSSLYVRRLNANELGFRNEKPGPSKMFLVNKSAAKYFFPPLGCLVKNDSREIELVNPNSDSSHLLNYHYHNDKYTDGGTRDEYRIYFDNNFSEDYDLFEPNDIVVFEQQKHTNCFVLHHLKKVNKFYVFFEEILSDVNHYLSDISFEDVILDLNKNNEVVSESKNIILYGPPGTGKTFTTKQRSVNIIHEDENNADHIFYNEIKKPDGRIKFVTMHQSFSYEDFMIGLKPVIEDDSEESMKFDYVPGVFMEICKNASQNIDQNYVLVIDEINRCNVSKVFGELITLIEEDKRGKFYTTLINGVPFTVPSNLFILGTMNTADKSIAMIDIALRRRFEFEAMYPNLELVKDLEKRGFMKKLNEEILMNNKTVDFLVGHSDFMKDLELVDIINKKTIPLLNEYFRGDMNVVENILTSCLTAINNTISIDKEWKDNMRLLKVKQKYKESSKSSTSISHKLENPSDEEEIIKIEKRIPKWFRNSNQKNHKILVNAIKLMGNDNKFIRKELNDYLIDENIDVGDFSINFRHMSIIQFNNHAKVFNKLEDDYYELWEPVKDFILSEYKKTQD
jgi:MoxR-like ATPase